MEERRRAEDSAARLREELGQANRLAVLGQVAAAGRLSRFRHTVNLGVMEARLARLLSDFAWDRMDRVFAHVLHGDAAGAARAA